MIDFQSPVGIESSSYRPCYSPSPWGEGRGEGELNLCGRCSALMSCPSGAFENSQQHARVIYDWVHRPQPTQSPEGTAEPPFLGRRLAEIHITIADGSHRPPLLPQSALAAYVQAFPRPFKAIQACPSLFKGFSKKDFFIRPENFRCPTLSPYPMITRPANSQSKSTVSYRKSTVDLGLEPLIWGENGLQTPFLLGSRHSFGPIKTGKL